MIDRAHYFFVFILIVFYFSCSEPEPEDCAGIINGSSICGCTDSTALNYDSTATYDDGSCLDCAGVEGGNNICGWIVQLLTITWMLRLMTAAVPTAGWIPVFHVF